MSLHATGIDTGRYTVRVDALTLLTPCMSFVLCLDGTDDSAGIQEFHDRGLAALGDRLTHFRAEQMKFRKPINERASSKLQVWLAAPTPGKSYYLEYFGCDEKQGVTAARWSLHFNPRSYRAMTPEFRQQWFASWRTMYERKGVQYLLPCTILRMTVPLDHPLADPTALLDWIRDLRLVKSDAFASGYAGYALNHFDGVVSSGMERLMNERLAALSLQHPGFDWHNSYYIVDRLLPFDPETDDFLPLIKRVNWLALLSRRTVSHLGGPDSVRKELLPAPDVTVESLGDGLVIRAGAAPQIGDFAAGDTIRPYRAVARIIRPVRMTTMRGPGNGFPVERAQEWLDAFDDGSGV